MQMWFKPYGHVVDMRPMDMEADDDSLAFIVQMSCKEEAINAFDALNGKSIMRGSHHVGKPCRVITQQMPQDVVIPLFEIVSVLFALFLERSATEPQLLARRSRALDRGRLLAAARQLAFQKKEAFAAWRVELDGANGTGSDCHGNSFQC